VFFSLPLDSDGLAIVRLGILLRDDIFEVVDEKEESRHDPKEILTTLDQVVIEVESISSFCLRPSKPSPSLEKGVESADNLPKCVLHLVASCCGFSRFDILEKKFVSSYVFLFIPFVRIDINFILMCV
jgi:hypothetical protein